MRPFYICAHRGRVVETEEVVRIVDQHIELLEKVLAKNTLDVEASYLEIVEVIDQHFLVGDGVRTGFEPVEAGEGSGGLGIDACDLGLPLGGEMEVGGQGGTSSRGALPERSPNPFTVTLTQWAPPSSAARVLAVASPKSLWAWNS